MVRDEKNDGCLFILPSLEVGGAERVLINWVNNFRFNRKILVVLSGDGPLSRFLGTNIEVCFLGHQRARRSFLDLIRIVRQKNPDIIVSTITHVNFLTLLLRPCFPRKSKIFVREATLPSSFFRRGWVRKWVAIIGYKFLYPHADAIICPARIIADEFKTLFGLDEKKLVVIPNPVDVDTLRSRALENADYVPYDGNDKSVRFVCVGRLHPAKGFDLLIEKLPSLPVDFKWTLNILGGGDERQRLQSMIDSLGLNHRVFLAGMVENPWKEIAQADMCLIPSRWEGMPNVALESLAVGTPVLAIRTAGGIAEIKESAPDQSVKIVDDYTDFVALMENVQPMCKAGPKKSLLPPCYSLDQVVEAFSDLAGLSKDRAL